MLRFLCDENFNENMGFRSIEEILLISACSEQAEWLNRVVRLPL